MSEQNTVISVDLEKMSLEQLAQYSQYRGHQEEKIREERLFLRGLIEKRLKEQRQEVLNQQIAQLRALRDGQTLDSVDAVAPGAVMQLDAGE